jgi:hypothetical protein
MHLYEKYFDAAQEVLAGEHVSQPVDWNQTLALSHVGPALVELEERLRVDRQIPPGAYERLPSRAQNIVDVLANFWYVNSLEELHRRSNVSPALLLGLSYDTVRRWTRANR